MSTPKAKTIIKPSLFEVVTKLSTTYVVAYDAAHAITSVIENWSADKNITSVKKLTDDTFKYLLVAKECLPQGLVNKTIEK
jgi:hypothetical protein